MTVSLYAASSFSKHIKQPPARPNDQMETSHNRTAKLYKVTYKRRHKLYSLNITNDDLTFVFFRLVSSSLSWYGAYLVKAFPLDMSQYNRMFASTRIPQADRDKIVAYEDSGHILSYS